MGEGLLGLEGLAGQGIDRFAGSGRGHQAKRKLMLRWLINRLKIRICRATETRFNDDAQRRHDLVQDDQVKAYQIEELRRDLIRMRTEQHGR